MIIANDWMDYELLDTGNGEKLERWGKTVLIRPDPQIIWPSSGQEKLWKTADAHYHRSSSGGGKWEYINKVPDRWSVSYDKLSFHIKPTDFKHTGLFPEQAANWKWIIERIKSRKGPVSVLNLFAYTGGATVAAAYAGAEVCHVDAAKGMVNWAKENIELSGLKDKPVRFITDDVIKFVQREKRRGKVYDAVIMDPPSYGRGPRGEIWKIEDALYGFMEECLGILSPEPLFVLINSYTTGFSPTVLSNILKMLIEKKYGGKSSCGEVGLPVTATKLILPCGIYGRWEAL